MKKFAVVLIAGLTFLTVSGCGVNDDFNDWLSDCIAADGIAGLTHVGEFSSDYVCYIDGEIVTLPGWEGY